MSRRRGGGVTEAPRRRRGGAAKAPRPRRQRRGGAAPASFSRHGASPSGRTAHWLGPRPGSTPPATALSGSHPKAALICTFAGLLRAAHCRRRPSCNRLAGSAAANPPARCVVAKFVSNIGPVPRGR